jgi:hypothetical protein
MLDRTDLALDTHTAQRVRLSGACFNWYLIDVRNIE